MNHIGTLLIVVASIALIIRLSKMIRTEAESDEMRIDKWSWLSYGVRQGWVTQHCAMHDAYYTEEEDAMFEEYDDPCIPILRFKED